MIRILMADDHPVIRSGLKEMLAGEVDMAIVGEVTQGDEVLHVVANTEPDVLLLDISLPGKNGLELLPELRTKNPNVKVLILTIHPERRYAIRALQSGAGGYLTKSCSPMELMTAIRKVAAGNMYLSRELADSLPADFFTANNRMPHEVLSAREFEVMIRLASGLTAHDIAKELHLSQATVYTYRDHVFKKMRMKSIAELTRYAIEHQLVD